MWSLWNIYIYVDSCWSSLPWLCVQNGETNSCMWCQCYHSNQIMFLFGIYGNEYRPELQKLGQKKINMSTQFKKKNNKDNSIVFLQSWFVIMHGWRWFIFDHILYKSIIFIHWYLFIIFYEVVSCYWEICDFTHARCLRIVHRLETF